MERPVIFAVDDDTAVLGAIQRDLRRQYGDRYRILRAESGKAALDAVKQLDLRNEPIALFLVDQRMPEVSGVQFLEEAKEMYPDAKRLLLTAYADTDAAIAAINTADIHYYLLKPWDPPEERLYPVLDELLDDWQAHFRPPFQGIRVIGHRWSPAAHQIKDFLTKNLVPYQWLDVETEPKAEELMQNAKVNIGSLPLVVFPDGLHLASPSPSDLAGRIGLQTRAEHAFYDLIVVGGGPAGLAAAVYGASEGLKTALIEREAAGGQAGLSARIDNYLGFPAGLSGGDLARRAVAQARRFGTEILSPLEATSVEVRDPYRIVRLSDSSELSCHALLIASGVSYRRLEAPGIDKLTGCGVYYGSAMTEALGAKDKDVYVVGGANSAGQASAYLARFARSVTMLVRDSGLSVLMSRYLIDQIEKTDNILVRTNTEVVEARGGEHLESIVVRDLSSGDTETLETPYLFVFIGAIPRTDWLDGIVERDERGFVLSGPDLRRDGRPPKGWTLERDPFLLETNVPGIFVAGDVRHGSIKRVASGVGEGAIAVSFVHEHLKNL
jgi:thioredoxin reductase (NADPH)